MIIKKEDIEALIEKAIANIKHDIESNDTEDKIEDELMHFKVDSERYKNNMKTEKQLEELSKRLEIVMLDKIQHEILNFEYGKDLNEEEIEF